jgi:hypothetical protein
MIMKNDNTNETTLKLAYDEGEHLWKVGPYKATITMEPALTINDTRNINSITVTVVNNGHLADQARFMMGFDSVGHGEDGKPILYAKFLDAYGQLEKNKKNLERYLNGTIDISVLKGLKPMAVEFERRAAGQSLGSNGIVF